MAFNNNYKMSPASYQKGYYGSNPYPQGSGPRSFNRPSFNRPVRQKRHSGCKMKENFTTRGGEKKAVVIYGWKYTRKHGIVSFVAVPASDKYQKGKSEAHTTMVAKITSQFGEKTVWCHWNKHKKILSFPDLKMVASPYQQYWSYLMPKR